MMKGLAIIAGLGRLPEIVHAAYPDALVVWFAGVGTDFIVSDGFEASFEKLGALFDFLEAREIRTLCFAGALTRPNLDPALMDETTQALAPRIAQALRQGDGALLGVVRAIFEEQAYQVQGAHALCPNLMASVGSMGRHLPVGSDTADLGRAREIHRTLSDLDIGQGVVMRMGQCLAVETLPGTRAMLDFVAQNTPPNARAGFLFKASKEGQDLDLDMASIGPDTIDQIAAAGLAGVYLAAGMVILIDRTDLIARADRLGLFVVGV